MGLLSATKLLEHVNSTRTSPFKKVIDEHEKPLAKKIVERKRAEYQATIDGFDYSKCTSLIDALKHRFANKGTKDFFSDTIWSVGAAAYDFIEHYVATCGCDVYEDSPRLLEYLKLLTHAYQHHRTLSHFSDAPTMDHDQAVGLATEVVMPPRLKADQYGTPNDFERVASGYLGTLFDDDKKKLRVLLVDASHHVTADDEALDKAAFYDLFQLPRLPPYERPGTNGARLAYYTDKDHIDEIKSKFQQAQADELRPLEKVDILSYVYLH